MPANTAATVAIVVAANSAAQSGRAQDAACAGILTSFNAAGSTPATRRAYAECVDRLEPQYTEQDEHMLKVGVSLLLACAVIGAIIGWFRSDWDRGVSAFFGAIAGIVAVVVVWGLIALGVWLVS